MHIWPGAAYPLGATWDGWGSNFALFSEVAEAVELCLFDDAGDETRVELSEVDGFVWHGYLPAISPGQRYGYRVHGPHSPRHGARCAPSKLLLDPYGKALDGDVQWDQALFDYQWTDPRRPNTTDSAPFMPKNVVINPFFDWGNDRPPHIPYHDTVIYEAHVRGLTLRHPEVPLRQRGTYAGIAHPAVIEHLKRIGVTAVELLPVHQFVPEQGLSSRGLTNYWGYNTIGFLAPHNRYCSAGQRGEQVGEFKTMVKALHTAGIEVILDVVYNHTAEGDGRGPTLSLPRHRQPRLLPPRRRQPVAVHRLHRLRQLAQRQAPALAPADHGLAALLGAGDARRRVPLRPGVRPGQGAARRGPAVHVLRPGAAGSGRLPVKLIAEPWDVGEGGYQVGNFPPLWTEWNGQYRDTIRDFWRGEPATLPEFASRLTGSSDLYETSGRRPIASINFVTCHDGFTLADLVSYNGKHNEANGEENRDGTDDNRSWNCGVEGRRKRPRGGRAPRPPAAATSSSPSSSPRASRCCRPATRSAHPGRQQQRLLPGQRDLLGGLVARGRRAGPARLHPEGRPAAAPPPGVPPPPVLPRPVHRIGGRTKYDITWLTPAGDEMTEEDWRASYARSVAVFLNGSAISEPDPRGDPVTDKKFLLLFNAGAEPITFTIPEATLGTDWEIVIDTLSPRGDPADAIGFLPKVKVDVASRAIVVLRSRT